MYTIGTVNSCVCEKVMYALRERLCHAVQRVHSSEYPVYAFEPKRNQYYARKIIETLMHDIPADCEKLIGVTDVDLCTPVLTFVYGEAQLGGRVALVSLKRLSQTFYDLPENETLLFNRLLKECLHELGHCYGMVHCSNTRCAMFFSSNILNIDNKSNCYCVKCQDYFDSQLNKEEHE